MKPRAAAAAPRAFFRRRELYALLLGAFALFLFLALYSYAPTDPGFWSSGRGEETGNWGGIFGAWIAGMLLFLFGYSAWFFILLAFWGCLWMLLMKPGRTPGQELVLLLRLFGTLLFLFSMSALIALNTGDLSSCGGRLQGPPCGSGGVFGMRLAKLVATLLGVPGGQLVLLVGILAGLSMASRISWLLLLEQLGRISWAGVGLVLAGGRGVGRSSGALLRVAATVLHRRSERRRAESKPTIVHKTAPPATPAPESDAPTAPAEPGVAIRSEVPERAPVLAQHGAEPSADGKVHKGMFDSLRFRGELPSLSMLDSEAEEPQDGSSEEELQDMSRKLEHQLSDFKITANVVSVCPGPVITRFEIQPSPGTKASSISVLSRDLARSLTVESVRVVEVIPGSSAVGIEIPNENRKTVRLHEVLNSQEWERSGDMELPLALGHDITGEPVVAPLENMPHLLVAGTTGSGKSVGLNAMLISLLFKCSPAEMRLILVDPKMLELSVYEGIPHLLTPVITDMKDAARGLRWCVVEMERRYRLMAALGVRNLKGYNQRVEQGLTQGAPLPDPLWEGEEDQAPPLAKLPNIVVVVDEFADMMFVVGKKVEELIVRLAQKARAAGLHLVLATQRPSVDVITGLIKANIPSRISYKVSNRVDSRIILDQNGAEQLLGNGDMLYMSGDGNVALRVHGAFVSDAEVHRIAGAWKEQGEAEYMEGVLGAEESVLGPVPGLEPLGSRQAADNGEDELYEQAVQCVTESRRASISFVQRKLRIGYNRAARLLELMEQNGVVSAMESNGAREVLAPPPPET